MKHTTAKVIMYCFTVAVVALLFWKAPEQAVQVMNAAAYILGGAAVGTKLGLIQK
jgi:hypothetical protein